MTVIDLNISLYVSFIVSLCVTMIWLLGLADYVVTRIKNLQIQLHDPDVVADKVDSPILMSINLVGSWCFFLCQITNP